jgi:D-alanyl-D-alanine dipeptidase
MPSLIARGAAVVLLTLVPQGGLGQDTALPAGFVRLRAIAPSIRQDIRYATPFNFTGKTVPGYERGECIARDVVAKALARAQARLEADGYVLKVYDCYRPVRSVHAFWAWSQAPGGDSMKPVFYPALDKSSLFALGYIAPSSRHSMGIAIDVGLVRADEEDAHTGTGGRCDGPFAGRTKESSLDFGTAYDCFSERSATRSAGIPAEARANRERLRRALEAEGFHNYWREWWHYEMNGAAARSYDFPVR